MNQFFGSEWIEVCVFLKFLDYVLVLFVYSSVNILDCWNFGKEKWMYFTVCNLCVSLLDK
jgi:hypothetical protein